MTDREHAESPIAPLPVPFPALKAEAEEIAAHHPSKDARAFAESVMGFLAGSPTSVATEAMIWQPIETAPKDGTLIMLGIGDGDDCDGVSLPGRWQEANEDAPDEMGSDAGFVDCDFQYFSTGRSFGVAAYRRAGKQPTHWQPRPRPPVTEQGKQETITEYLASAPAVDEAAGCAACVTCGQPAPAPVREVGRRLASAHAIERAVLVKLGITKPQESA